MEHLKNLKIHEYPWRHVIIDDFLMPMHYERILNAVQNLDSQSSEILTFSSREDQIIDNQTFLPPDLIAQLVETYVPTALKLLDLLAPPKLQFFEQSQFQIAITGPKASYRVHEDAVCKLLSGIIYLYPIESSGTYLHGRRDDLHAHEIQWKPNRAVFFSRRSKRTWHSYKGDGKTKRIALVFNLVADELEREGILRTEFSSYPTYLLHRFLRFIEARLPKSSSV